MYGLSASKFQTHGALCLKSKDGMIKVIILTWPQLSPGIVQSDSAFLLVTKEFMDDLNAASTQENKLSHCVCVKQNITRMCWECDLTGINPLENPSSYV